METHRARRWTFYVGVLVLLMSVLSLPAASAATTSITGTVTSAGSPAAGAWVAAYANCDTLVYSAYATAGGDGTYTLSGLSAGDYLVRALNAYGDTTHRATWYPSAAACDDATPVSLGEGGVTADIALLGAAEITGTVRNSSGTSVSGVSLGLLDAATHESVLLYSPQTAAGGTYSLASLPPGAYHLQFVPPTGSTYIGEFHENAWSIDAATVIDVSEGDVVTIDAALSVAASLHGSVQDQTSGLDGFTVTVRDATSFDVVTSVPTEGGGWFFTRVPAGTYVLDVTPPEGSAYLPEWYENVSDGVNATPLTVEEGQSVFGIGIVVSRIQLEGTVVHDSGAPVFGVAVEVWTPGGWLRTTAVTDADGRYAVGDLGPGEYRVHFSDTRFADEWWNDATSADGAESVVITATSTVTADAALACVSCVGGTVRDTAGQPVADMWVLASTGAESLTSTLTDAAGRYVLWPGVAGDVTISTGQTDYVSTRAPVTVVMEQRTSLDLVVQRPGSITVQLATGKKAPTAAVWAFAYSPSGFGQGGEVTTTSPHTMTWLAPGQWTVRANAYDSRYLPFVQTVTVVEGQTTTVTVRLVEGGTVIATVGVRSGAVPPVEVGLYDTNGILVAGFDPDGSTTIEINGIPAGRYYLSVHPYSEAFKETWYLQAETMSQAKLIQVKGGGTLRLRITLLPV